MQSELNQKGTVYFMNLDIFRFIAAFMIVMLHGFEGWHGWFGYPGFMTAGDYKTLTKPAEFLNRAISNLGFGVDMFFLISGFLITFLLIKEYEESGGINLKKFYMRRILRIWPLYYFVIIIAPLIVHWLGETTTPNYLMTALFLNNFETIKTEQWIYPFSHFWSICIEEHFYLFWPLFIKFLPKKRLPEFFCSVLFLSILFRSYVFMTNPYPWMPLFLNTLSRCDVLAIGSLIGYLHYYKPLQIKVPFSVRMTLYLIFFLCFFIDPMNAWDTFFLAVFKKYFYVLICGFAMYNYMFNPDARFKIKTNNFFHYLGKVSYGIYIYHNVLILIIIKKILIDYNIHNIYAYILLLIGGSIIIPVISYELIEKPFLKLKRKFEVVRTRL